MGTTRLAFVLVALAVIVPHIYDRYLGIYGLLTNSPDKLERVYEFKNHDIKFADQIRNCEDVILEEKLGIAFLSCDPGRDRWNTVMGTFQPPHPTKPQDNNGAIYIYNYAKSTDSITPLTFPNWPGATDFHPLGIAFDSTTSTLYVINHRRHSGSVIEIFHVSLSTHSATHTRTFSHPLIPAPNAMHLLGPGKMYISNDHYYRAAQSPLLSKIENFGGFPGGSVVYLDTVAPEESKIVARVPFANGIVDVNATTLAVASSMKPGIYFYEILANKGLEYVTYVRTPAGADNLSKDGNGKVLVAGHPYSPALVGVAKGRVGCDEEGSEEQRRACGCWAPSWVGEWTEEGGLRTLLSDGAQGEKGICSSSTAVRDVGRGVGIVSMLYGKGIAVFRE